MFAASKTDSASTGGYQISRSLRFNSADSAYLNRTPASASNQKTWTWSGWIKRSALGTNQTIFNAGGNGFVARFNSSTDYLEVYNYSGSYQLQVLTAQVFRDVSAWYHIVIAIDTTQATDTNRFKLYVNGSQVTSFYGAPTYPSQNTDLFVNGTGVHALGVLNGVGQYFDGYMTEVNFVNASQLTPSSFGETNAQTGVWQPKAYSGSYGTNGFYLNFSDNSNTTAATLGKDYSGNGNNWTPNNFSVTAGAGNDSLVDSPTSYGTDTGVGGTVRGNYCTLNPLDKSQYVVAPVNGNLDVLNAGNFVEDRFVGTIAVNSGKWYFETTITGTYANTQIGIHDANSAASTSTMYRTYVNNGNKISGTTSTSYGSSFTTNDIIGVAVDMDSGKIWFSKNGTFQASGDPVAGTNAAFTDLSGTITPLAVDYAQAANGTSGHNLNFGQRPFAYTAPSGFKALCTQNLPTPTIGATTATQAGKYFNAVTYTGTGSSLGVTGVGFQPDFVWVKSRSAATDHGIYDAVRGVQKQLESNTTTAETTETTGITAFGSDGFTTGALAQLNTSAATYVGWQWKANGSGSTNTAGQITSTVSANTTSGFSIVTFTTDGTTKTVGHGLGVKPSLIIAKVRNGVGSWIVMTDIINGSMQYGTLNTANAFASIGYSAPTSTVFQYNDNNGNTQVAYCFASIEGYSKIGSYVGTGATDGPFIYCGFRPAYLLIKNSNVAGQYWDVYDNKRNTYNPETLRLFPNASDAEGSATQFDFLSNGFKVISGSTSSNGSGNTIIYMAFAESPFKYSLAR